MQDFLKYLTNLQLSKDSLKNYKSDANHFLSWLILKIKSLGSYIETIEDSVPFLNHEIANEYKNYLTHNKTPRKTVNRRLSTLRHLSKHLVQMGSITKDFMQGIENLTDANISNNNEADQIIEQFRAHLRSEKVSESSIKNYISDVKQFVTWLENNPKYAQSN